MLPLLFILLQALGIVHHHYPRYFTRLSWWESLRDSAIACGVILLIGAWIGILGWQLGLFAFVATNANQVHKWAHRTRAENGRVISFLQDIGLFMTPRNHAVLHSDPKNTYYCPATNLVNPLLAWRRFWNAIEWVIWRVTGVKHRQDTSIRGQGPGSGWLKRYRAFPVAISPRPLTAAGVRARLRACARLTRAGGGGCRPDEVMGSFPPTIQS